MSSLDSCCTCAALLSDVKVPYDPLSEKQICFNRRLECCSRVICADCQYKNRRFESYCPFCQISTKPSVLPPTGLRLPPTYTGQAPQRSRPDQDEDPPPYNEIALGTTPSNGGSHSGNPPEIEDVVHHLSSDDSIHSLSIAYHVPQSILRSHNSLYSDSLLAARKFLLIPRSHYDGPSLSTPPDPVEEERKNKVRRWMVATKCPEYDVAGLYLKGSDFNLELAIEAFKADEQWEKENPMKGKAKQTGNRRIGGLGLSGQLR